MYLLDSNIISFNVYHPERFPLLEVNFRATKAKDRFISVVTAEEIIWGRLETVFALHEARRDQLIRSYNYFRDALAIVHCYHNHISVFNEEAYEHLRGMPGNVGGNDRLIAAIALSNDFTLISHDRQDFADIQAAKPDLRIQDWCVTDYSAVNTV